MPIKVVEPTSSRGKHDARRHADKRRDMIRKNIPGIIANESIITRNKKGKLVRIPIRAVDIPTFRPKRGDGGQTGVGQGPAKPGDIIDQQDGSKPGKPGNAPGEDVVDTEFTVEEIIAWALEELGLPNMENKTTQDIEEEIGFKISGISHVGPSPLLSTSRTAKEGMRRFWIFLRYLERETNGTELDCFKALKQTDGILNDALDLLKQKPIPFKPEVASLDIVEAFSIPTNDDMRYLDTSPKIEHTSRAVVIAMMDVSGSMGDRKKFFARITLYWIVEVLRKLYDTVEIRFITHHSTAKIVMEEDFFTTRESGGTNCASAYELAHQLLDDSYPKEQWNRYVWHFSDGDDFDEELTVKAIQNLLPMVNMLAYGEVWSELEVFFQSGKSKLWKALLEGLPLEEKFWGKTDEEKIEILVGDHNVPFIGLLITKPEHVYPAIKLFLQKNRWRIA